jgi:hypothetical protein
MNAEILISDFNCEQIKTSKHGRKRYFKRMCHHMECKNISSVARYDTLLVDTGRMICKT